jgi:transcriptional regulator with XRE-family HTH domain
MGLHQSVAGRLRQRIREERERHGWSQARFATKVSERGLVIHPSTIAKIEMGKRAVHVDELSTFADIFGTSIDALVGRRGASTDLAWAASKLTSNAQKMATDLDALRTRLRGAYDDVRAAVGPGGEAVDNLLEHAGSAILQLSTAQDWLNRLANQFPLPTDFGPTTKGEEVAGPKLPGRD